MLPLREWAFWVIRMVLVWAWYFLRAVMEMRDARKTRRDGRTVPLRSDKLRVLVHACIDESYFAEDGSAQDRYLTVLPQALRQKGYDVVIMPWLCNVSRSRRDAFAWFRQWPERYLIPEDYYSLWDYIWAAWIVISQAWFPSGKQVYQGIDVTLLVAEARRQGAADTGIALFVRYARLIRKLKAIGFKLDIFVDKFENMVTEKPQVIALRTYMPEVITVGFQHYVAPYPLQLHMFTTPEEAVEAPHPDVIVCNSQFCVDLFAKEGFPGHKLRVGPSLRYLHLMDNHTNQGGIDNHVLVILPLDTGVAGEMVYKLVEAFPSDEGVRFLLKVHPAMPRRQWLLALGERTLPAHMLTVDGEMSEAVRNAACAIASPGTTAGLELLLAGVPVVTVGRETDLDMNPFAWFSELEGSIYSPDQLRNALMGILSTVKLSREAVRAWAEKYRPYYLSPLNDGTIQAFVEPPPRKIH